MKGKYLLLVLFFFAGLASCDDNSGEDELWEEPEVANGTGYIHYDGVSYELDYGSYLSAKTVGGDYHHFFKWRNLITDNRFSCTITSAYPQIKPRQYTYYFLFQDMETAWMGVVYLYKDGRTEENDMLINGTVTISMPDLGNLTKYQCDITGVTESGQPVEITFTGTLRHTPAI